MAKLIKKGTLESSEGTSDNTLAAEPATLQRAPIIDRDTYAARSEAQQIRERAQAQSNEIIASAQAEAEQILDAARAEAEELVRGAVRKGYDEGKAQGVAELMEVVAHATQRSEQFEAQVVPQLTELALAIGKKIIGMELEFNPESVVGIVRQALSEKAKQRREVLLRVNPEDVAVLREHKAELLEVLSRAKEISIHEDPSVTRFGVIIETDAGKIDAQLDTQLAVFEKALRNVR